MKTHAEVLFLMYRIVATRHDADAAGDMPGKHNLGGLDPILLRNFQYDGVVSYVLIT